MKSALIIISVLLFTSLTIFSQTHLIKHQSYRSTTEEIFNQENFPLPDDFKSHQSSTTKTTTNKTVFQNGYVLVEALLLQWNEIYLFWENSTYETYDYDENANLIEFIFRFWDGSNWINGQRWLYAYDVNNNLIEFINQFWNGTNWENWYRRVYTYDANNNLIERIKQDWNDPNWTNFERNTYTYDGSNNLLIDLYQVPDGSGWLNDYRYVYAYDVNNNRIEQLYQNWNSAWVNSIIHYYNYDNNNNLILDLMQYWIGSVWVNSWKIEITYISGNLVYQETEQEWYSSAWENYLFRQYLYDGNNNLTTLTENEWDGYAWINMWRHLFAYDVSQNLTEKIEQLWYYAQWENDYGYFYSYDEHNNRIEELGQSWVFSAWDNRTKRTYTYLPTLNVAPVATDDYVTIASDDTTTIHVLSNDYDLNGDGLVIYDMIDPLYCTAILMEGDTTISLIPDPGFLGSDNFDYVISDGQGAFDTATVWIEVVLVEMVIVGNLGLEITDFGTTSNSIFINLLDKTSLAPQLVDVQVLIDTVLHTATGDLIFTLTHDALTDTIIYQAGGTGDNFINTILSDNGTTPIANGTPPFTGVYKPYQPLASFAGNAPNGEWILEIYDGASGNTGTLEAWGLILYYQITTEISSNENKNPTNYSLEQNYPNPFNPSTTITFAVPKETIVNLSVYNVLGELVSTLVNEQKKSGYYEYKFDASSLASGVYIFRIKAGDFIETKKMVLLR